MSNKLTRAAWAVLGASAALFSAASAHAQDSEAILKPRIKPRESPQHFVLEFRFGPYRPQIDDEPALNGATPYKDTFGDMQRLLAGAEFDWQILRIPYVGTIGPGFSVGYTLMTANAKKLNSDQDSGDETNLSVFLTYAVLVLRADVFMREVGIPLVPYVKAGLGYAPWRTYTSGGTSTVDTGTGTVEGKGQTFYLHGAGGLAFQLDVLDKHSAKNLDESWGINHTYLYGEWMVTSYAISQANSLRVGTNSWVAGVAFEF